VEGAFMPSIEDQGFRLDTLINVDYVVRGLINKLYSVVKEVM